MQRTEQRRADRRVLAGALMIGLALVGLGAGHARAAPYKNDVTMHGTPMKSARISGYAGTPVELAVDDDDHAMYGMSSEERRNNPCTLWIGTEDINDSGDKHGDFRSLCGGTPLSRVIKAEYADDMTFGRRVFVTGVRVCTNNRETRVKGFQLRGKRIEDDSRLAALEYSPSDPAPTRLASGGGGSPPSDRSWYVNDSKNPADYRNNCNEWHAWAECPEPNQVATALIGHFEAGTEPRSLTGVRLLCRNLSQSFIGATR